MSTLKVANVQSTSATSNLVLRTGNTSGAFVALNPNSTGIVFFSNSSTSFLTVNSTPANNEISNTGNTTATGIVIFSGNVTPALIAANTVDWAPPVANTFMVRVSANNNANLSEYSIFGMTGGVNGQIITLSNIGPTKIILRNNDAGNSTFNQANASNRFLLPNHMAIGGYQSVQLIYDGTNARWRPLSSLRLAYTHKSVLTNGFFAGGSNGSAMATSEKITYSTESRSALISGATTLSQARWNVAGAGNSDKGFLSGGYSGAAFSLVTDKVTFSTEAIAAVAGANLSQAREGVGAAGNSDKGIFAGGATTVGSATPVTTGGRTTYSTETHAAVSGTNLSQARGLLAAVGNSDKGFFAGGFIAPAVAATTGRTTYSTETHAAVSGANLSQSRRGPASTGDSDKGFFAGGDTPTNVATADRTTYSTETTAAVTGANLSQARTNAAGAGNSNKGFISGGFSPTASTTSDRTTYASETTAAVTGANLGAAKGQLAAV